MRNIPINKSLWGIGRVSPTVPLGGRTGGINYLYSTLLFRVTNLIPLHTFLFIHPQSLNLLIGVDCVNVTLVML
jgi:hypothetical protein